MRMRWQVLAAGVAVAASGCSSSGHPAASGPKPTPPSAPYVVPKHVAGELARDVSNGNLANRSLAGEAIPKPKVSYLLTIDCVSNPGHRDSVHWEVRLARPKTSRLFEAGTLPCAGQVEMNGLAQMPRQPIQLSLTWVGNDAGPRAYGVIAPA